MSPKQLKAAIGAGVFLVVLILVYVLLIPPYNQPKFENIENNETGFLIPLDTDTSGQVRFESAEYLKEKNVASKRVQIQKRWVQTGRLPAWGEYMDTVRLIKVKRESVSRQWTEDPVPNTPTSDDAITVQSKNGTRIRLAFNCTAFIPESDAEKGAKAEHPEGAEHFLYYYKGDSLEHIMDREVRDRVQSAAAQYCAKLPDDTLRGSQHDLIEAVQSDVVPFFKKRGLLITNIGLSGGFHYTNMAIQKSIDDAIAAQQLKVAAQAMQEKEKVEQETKLLNQKIQNDTLILAAEGKAKALAAELEGSAKAKQSAARIEAETAKIEADGKASAVKAEAEAESFRMEKLEKYRDFVVALKTIEVEKTWRSLWGGGVPSTVIQGRETGTIPFLPIPAVAPPPQVKK